MPGHYKQAKSGASRGAKNIEFGSGNTEGGDVNTPMYEHKKGKCPPGFYWNAKKQKCIQLQVGP